MDRLWPGLKPEINPSDLPFGKDDQMASGKDGKPLPDIVPDAERYRYYAKHIYDNPELERIERSDGCTIPIHRQLSHVSYERAAWTRVSLCQQEKEGRSRHSYFAITSLIVCILYILEGNRERSATF